MTNDLAAVAVTFALPTSADTVGPFTDLVVFSDSLSDPGNIFVAIGVVEPPGAFYPDCQFTNGDTSATLLGVALAFGTTFASGDAPAVDNCDRVPDFDVQRALYQTSNLEFGDNPLTVATFDGNDLRVLLEQPLPTTFEEQDAFQIFVGSLIQSMDTTIVLGVNDPIQTGLNDIVVFGPPDFNVIPGMVNDAALNFTVAGIVDAFNETLKGAFTVFDAPESTANVTFFDAIAFQDRILAKSNALGLTNTTQACLTETFFCGDDVSSYLFFDGLHPTQEVHSELARAIREAVTPALLPGGLSLALGALMLPGGLAKRCKVAPA